MVLGLIIIIITNLFPGNLYVQHKKSIDKLVVSLYSENAVLGPEDHIPPFQYNQKLEVYRAILKNGNINGYLVIAEAPSKVETFTYLVAFNPFGQILKVKVLQYRENYGGEISSKRFLQQFVGKSKGENMMINQDIDGISGATISTTSIARAIVEDSKLIMNLVTNDQ